MVGVVKEGGEGSGRMCGESCEEGGGERGEGEVGRV